MCRNRGITLATPGRIALAGLLALVLAGSLHAEPEAEEHKTRDGITIVPGPPPLNSEREPLDLEQMQDRDIERAQRQRGRPEQTREAEIEEKLGEQVPLAAQFTTSDGEQLTLGELIDGDRPVILNLVYFNCPTMCGMITESIVQAMNQIPDWQAGEEYEVITLSFDPQETPEQANLARNRMMDQLDNPASAQGWHFLVGQQDQIDKVTEATGFNLYWSDRVQQFLHPTAFIVLMPDGQVSRYFYGLDHNAGQLRLSLVEASDGQVGSAFDRVMLFCYDFDPSLGQYTPAVMRLMQIGAALTVLVLATAIVTMSVYGSRRQRARQDQPTQDPPPSGT